MQRVTKQYLCDRCGTEIDGENSSRFHKRWLNICGIHAKDGFLDGATNVDLCPKCRKSFDRWMRNGGD